MPRQFKFPKYPPAAHKSGQARLRIQGKDHYLGVWNSPESHAEYARLAEIMAHGVPIAMRQDDAKQRTVADIADAWINEEMPRRYKPGSTELHHFRYVADILVRLFGPLQAAEFDVTHLKVIRRAMVTGSWMRPEEVQKRRLMGKPIGWCRNNVSRQIVRLRTIWRWAEEEKLVPRGSWQHLLAMGGKMDVGVRDTKPRHAVPDDRVQATLPFLPPVVSGLVQVQLATGMRPGEIVKMKVGDIDTNGPGGSWLYRLTEHKNAWRPGQEVSVVVLGQDAVTALRPWYDAAKRRGGKGFIFPTKRREGREHYTANGYYQAVAAGCEEGEIPHWTPYQLRHAAKTRIKRAAGLDAARAVLRQKSLSTTNEYDQQQDLDLAVEAIRKSERKEPA